MSFMAVKNLLTIKTQVLGDFSSRLTLSISGGIGVLLGGLVRQWREIG